MKPDELLRLRLHHQQISRPRARSAGEVVSSLVAMQAQEFAMARWAIGLRMAGKVRDADITNAFNAGEILRTHVMRPTWHFVAPADIRWLLELTAPRVHAANAYSYRKHGLDAAVFKRSDAVLTRALRGRCLTRTALQGILAKSGVKAEGERLSGIVMHAELEGLICSGPREGRQFTYALLDERAPSAPPRTRSAALSELSHRYFASRGPATAQDFATWSGLTLRDARAGMDSLSKEFRREVIDGIDYVYRPGTAAAPSATGITFLMPDYDEYGMSYKDRRAMFSPAAVRGKLRHNRMIIASGKIVGSWRRSPTGDIELQYSGPMSGAQLAAIARALRKFSAFTGSDSGP